MSWFGSKTDFNLRKLPLLYGHCVWCTTFHLPCSPAQPIIWSVSNEASSDKAKPLLTPHSGDYLSKLSLSHSSALPSTLHVVFSPLKWISHTAWLICLALIWADFALVSDRNESSLPLLIPCSEKPFADFDNWCYLSNPLFVQSPQRLWQQLYIVFISRRRAVK